MPRKSKNSKFLRLSQSLSQSQSQTQGQSQGPSQGQGPSSSQDQGPSSSQGQGPSQTNNTLTLQTLRKKLGELNIDDQVNNLVRYLVMRAGNHVMIKETEIKKNVISKVGVKYQEIIEKASNILKNVYGYNLIVSNPLSKSSREFIISNALPYIEDPTTVADEAEYPEDAYKVPMLLILTHIFMSNGSASEDSLYSFLKSLSIDVERTHEVFGNVKDFIHRDLKNKQYLKIETDQFSKKKSFSWGHRAEKEISKHEILKFVCKIYKDGRRPSSWESQFKAAEEQKYENHKDANK